MTRRALNRYGRACMRTLEKRRDHLRRRIASSPVDLSYDRAEASAIDWALDFIRATELRESGARRCAQTSDLRDEWECEVCGSGLCVRNGDGPETPNHMVVGSTNLLDRVCGRYVFVGECSACKRDREREDAETE